MNVACARRRDVERCAGARRREKRPVYRSVVLKIPVDTIASSTFGRFDALVGVSRITLTRGVAALDTINSVIDSRLSGVNNGNDPTRKGFERRVAFEVFKQQISADTRAIGAPRLVGENRNRWKARRTRRASFHYGRLINLTILPVAGFIDAKRHVDISEHGYERWGSAERIIDENRRTPIRLLTDSEFYCTAAADVRAVFNVKPLNDLSTTTRVATFA